MSTETVYVCGHRNPDTDAIVAAIGYAALRNALGDNGYTAARLGHVSDETSFILKRFGFAPPMRLTTVRTQVRDLDFDHPPLLNKAMPVSKAWEIMQRGAGYTAVPVTDEKGKLSGMLTSTDIAEHDLASVLSPSVEDVPIYNLLSALEGRIINNDDDVFESVTGEMVIALPCPGEPLRGVKPASIVLCGEQEDVAEKALEIGVGCLILCQSSLAEKYRGVSSKTCIIVTPCDAYRAARMICQAVPVERIAKRDEVICFHLDDFLDDVRESVLTTRHRSYPVLDAEDNVVGTLGRYHLLRPKRKKLVLVDHNEVGQSVPGLEQATLLGIIDHHRLGDVQTGYPIFMRNEPVGSTATIVSTMFQEHGITPSPELAGLLASAILSDTVMFRSPTATPRDRRIAERLAHIAGLDLDTLGKEIFTASQNADKPAEVLLKTDFKEFHIAGHELAISQITTMDSEQMIRREQEFFKVMAAMKDEKHYDLILLMITDVLKVGTELAFLGDEDIIRQAFPDKAVQGNRVFLEGVVSRKKQVVPALAVLWG